MEYFGFNGIFVKVISECTVVDLESLRGNFFGFLKYFRPYTMVVWVSICALFAEIDNYCDDVIFGERGGG